MKLSFLFQSLKIRWTCCVNIILGASSFLKPKVSSDRSDLSKSISIRLFQWVKLHILEKPYVCGTVCICTQEIFDICKDKNISLLKWMIVLLKHGKRYLLRTNFSKEIDWKIKFLRKLLRGGEKWNIHTCKTLLLVVYRWEPKYLDYIRSIGAKGSGTRYVVRTIILSLS